MNRLYIVLAIFSLMSCETIIEVDIPVEAPKLVANAFITPDSVIKVQVSQSKHVLDLADLKVVEGATVNIFENGQWKETLQKGALGVYTSTFQPSEGNEYTLQVEADAYTSVQASTSIVPKIQIASLEYTTRQTEVGTSCVMDSCYTVYDTEYVFEMTFEDDPNETNYYEISGVAPEYYINSMWDDDGNIISEDTIYTIYDLYFYSDDAAVSNGEFAFDEGGYYAEKLAFSDNLFNGKKYTFKFSTTSYHAWQAEEDSMGFYLHVKTIDRARYLYYRSKELQYMNEGNPFAEPANVFNNVENGYGIFGSYNANVYLFKPE